MPKSKRNKQIELAKTKKRGLTWKKNLYEEVRSSVDKYANACVFSVNDMRNSKMKTVREQWKHSRFFFGKNKIMAMALGRFAEEEYKPNIHKLGQQIKGQRGLLFTNKPIEEVLNWFRSYSEGVYARSGNVATDTVSLTAGPLTMFPHNEEPHLRQLGLPTSLVKGVIHLVKDHEVCKAGDVLTPETAKILELLGYEMAEFHITIDCVWSQDGSFMQLTESIDTGTKENKKGKKTSLGSKSTEIVSNPPDMEEMEVECEEGKDSEDSEDENNNYSDMNSVSAQIEECNDLKENNESEFQDNSDKYITEHEVNETSSINCESGFQDNSDKNITEDEVNETSSINCDEPADVNEDTSNIIKSKVNDTLGTNDNELGGVNEDATPDIMECKIDEITQISDKESVDVSDKTTSSTRKSHPSKRKSVKTKPKKVSLPKTPDANTSQDSPVFRQLRNRSVKFSAKKK